MDYLPEIVVDPSHARLQITSIDEFTSTQCPIWHNCEQVSSFPRSDQKYTPNDVLEEPEIQHMLYTKYFQTLTRTLAVIHSNDSLLAIASDKSDDLGPVPVAVFCNMFKSVVKERLKDNPKRAIHNHHQDKQILEIAYEAMSDLKKYRDVLTNRPTGIQGDFGDISQVEVLFLSLQCLVETLHDLTLPQLQLSRLYSIAEPYPFWIDNILVKTLLRGAGWDESEISSLPQDIRFRYYLSFLSRGAPELLRRRSSVLPPKNEPYLKQQYSATHLCRSNGCGTLKIDLSTTDTAPDNPSFNLVSFSQPKSFPNYLRLEKRSVLSNIGEGPAFVAFSHVRSDGLGSSLENGLPTCQVEFLQDLSNQLLPAQEHPVPFYIDTLCVPLKKPAKTTALRNMQRVFENAAKVLVLDKELSNTEVSPLPQENLTRIRYSVFMRRTYTVAECAIAQHVYFHFRHGTLVALNDLYSDYDQGDEFPLLDIVSSKLRGQNTLTPKNFEELSLALAWLSDDLHVSKMYLKEQTADLATRRGSDDEFLSLPEGSYATPEPLDMSSLRKLLRLGFLALPQMRYFAEATEAGLLDTIANKILQAYQETFNGASPGSKLSHQNLLPSDLPERSAINHVLGRLGTLHRLTSSVV